MVVHLFEHALKCHLAKHFRCFTGSVHLQKNDFCWDTRLDQDLVGEYQGLRE